MLEGTLASKVARLEGENRLLRGTSKEVQIHCDIYQKRVKRLALVTAIPQKKNGDRRREVIEHNRREVFQSVRWT